MAIAKVIDIPAPVFEPTFEVSENMAPDIVGVKDGQGIEMIISYEVIEKLKSFAILRVNTISLKPSKRTF